MLMKEKGINKLYFFSLIGVNERLLKNIAKTKIKNHAKLIDVACLKYWVKGVLCI